jgi:hypothetical protein
MTKMTVREAMRTYRQIGSTLDADRHAKLSARFASAVRRAWLWSRIHGLAFSLGILMWPDTVFWRGDMKERLMSWASLILIVLAAGCYLFLRRARPIEQLAREVTMARIWALPLLVLYVGLGLSLLARSLGGPQALAIGIFVSAIALMLLLSRSGRGQRWIDRDWME